MEQTSGADRWQARYDKATARGQVRDADFTTLSGMPVEPVYGPGLHGIPKRFLGHASRGEVLEEIGLTPEAIADRIAATLQG